MTVTTNTLGSNSAEIVVQGPESWLNVITAVDSFITSHGWSRVPDTVLTVTATATNSVGNLITVSNTTGLVAGMPILFSATLGSIQANTPYYVLAVVTTGVNGAITISTSNVVQNSAAAVLTQINATGSSTITVQINNAVALTNNSTNYRQRVYYAPNLTGSVYKYMCINWADLSIDTAQLFTLGSLSGSYYYYSGTNTAYRFNHYYNMNYPRSSYFYSNTSPTTGIQIPLYPGFVWTNYSGYYNSGGFGTITLATNQGYTFYPNQTLAAYSPSSGHYALATVSSWSDSSGSLTMNNPYFGTTNAGNYTDWILVNYQPSYNFPGNQNPVYIYINATARSCTIQFRDIDGTWQDWNAVCETENPLGLQNNWGLTTGYMISNTGYTEVANGIYGWQASGVAGTNQLIQQSTASSLSFGASAYRQTPLTYMNKAQKYVTFTGPFAVPYSYTARPGSYASQTSKLITPLGEIGYMTTLRRQLFAGVASVSTTAANAVANELATVYFRGAGDLAPTQTSIPGSNPINFLLTTAASSSGGTATLTFAAQASAPFIVGQSITVNGVTPTGFNGTYTVTACTTTSVSYLNSTSGPQSTAGTIAAASGTKHWAMTPSLLTDIGNESVGYVGSSATPTNVNITAFLMNTRADTIEGILTGASINTGSVMEYQGVLSSVRDQSQYRTQQPTTLGRLYGLKIVTNGLATINTINIKVDSNGFVSNSGSGTDHLVFSTPSYYQSPPLQYLSTTNYATYIPALASGNYDTIVRTCTATSGYSITVSSAFNSSNGFILSYTPVYFTGNTGTSGIAVNTIYYTNGSYNSGTTFTVSAVPGGTNIYWATTSTLSFTAVFGFNGRESINEQNQIRTSQQAAVAFPK
jgi:hypothetical protein